MKKKHALSHFDNFEMLVKIGGFFKTANNKQLQKYITYS